jgi:hypothetical protein
MVANVAHRAAEFLLRGRVRYEIDGVAPRHFQDFAIAEDVGHPQRRQAGLLGSEEFAGAAQLQIHF